MQKTAADLALAMAFYANGIPFNILRDRYFKRVLRLVSLAGGGYKPPCYDRVRNSLLLEVSCFHGLGLGVDGGVLCAELPRLHAVACMPLLACHYAITLTHHTHHTHMCMQAQSKVDVALEEVMKIVKVCGCTIVSDGWSSTQNRPLLNFLSSTPKGTKFLRAVDSRFSRVLLSVDPKPPAPRSEVAPNCAVSTGII